MLAEQRSLLLSFSSTTKDGAADAADAADADAPSHFGRLLAPGWEWVRVEVGVGEGRGRGG